MTDLPEWQKTDWLRYQVWQQGEIGIAKKMRRNCTDGKGKEFMHDFETTTWKAEM